MIKTSNAIPADCDTKYLIQQPLKQNTVIPPQAGDDNDNAAAPLQPQAASHRGHASAGRVLHLGHDARGAARHLLDHGPANGPAGGTLAAAATVQRAQRRASAQYIHIASLQEEWR